MNFKNISNPYKKIILVLSDIFIIVFSITASFSLRLEKVYLFWKIDYRVFSIFFIVFFTSFYFLNIYQILLRFFDNYSIIKIIKATLICQFILIIINFLIYEIIYLPRSISFIAPILTGILIVTHRIILNYLLNVRGKHLKQINNILIYGVNESTVALLKNLRQFPNYGVVKCFVDTTGKYKKREINGIKIYRNENLLKIIKKTLLFFNFFF